MPKRKVKTVGVKRQEESPRVKEEEDEYNLLDVKQEPAEADLDEEADYLEPTVTITQDDEDDPGPVISVKVELEEGEEEVEEKEEEEVAEEKGGGGVGGGGGGKGGGGGGGGVHLGIVNL